MLTWPAKFASFDFEFGLFGQIFFAFCGDVALYTIFQTLLMPKAPAKYRYLPFFGVAAYLLDSRSKSVSGV